MNKTSTFSEIQLFTPEKFLQKLDQGGIDLIEPRCQVVKSIIKMARIQNMIIKYHVNEVIDYNQ